MYLLFNEYRRYGFADKEQVVEIVQLLTHDEDVDYFDYIKKIQSLLKLSWRIYNTIQMKQGV